MKLENIIFESKEKNARLKIIDMGLSQYYEKNKYFENTRGTLFYMSPELLGGCYDHKVDIWACGVILYKLITRMFPFRFTKKNFRFNRRKQKRELIKIIYEQKEDIYDQVKEKGFQDNLVEFLQKMLHVDPRQRPEASELLQHDWLNTSVNIEKCYLGFLFFLFNFRVE